MVTPFVELRNISKYFSKVIANKDVSFSIERGEVLALLGENGAGKSTVMKILYGLYHLDEGEILIDGVKRRINSPKDAMSLGISMIQQHFSLVNAHTVTENIILGNASGVINWEAKEKEIGELARRYGFEIDPAAYIRDLTVGQQQKVEILKALYQKTSLLIMDEPTAVLTPQESDLLMKFVRDFTVEGNAVIFITHKLKEVMEVADRIIVMRNGEITGTLNRAETDERELSRLMIGRDLIEIDRSAEAKTAVDSPSTLTFEHVNVNEKDELPVLSDISFSIHAGEVFGIAGVSGNGQQALCDVLCGSAKISSGSITLNGVDISNSSVRSRIEKGISYVPSDRQRDGMVMDMTLAENMMLKDSYSQRWTRHGFIDRRKVADAADSAIRDFTIKASGPDDKARSLSGGNQQKVIVAREVRNAGDLILFDQPTRGLDLGAMDYVHKTILSERASGKAILLISTDLNEVLSLSDRFTVLYKGRMMGIFEAGTLNAEQIGLLMAGYELKGEEAGS